MICGSKSGSTTSTVRVQSLVLRYSFNKSYLSLGTKCSNSCLNCLVYSPSGVDLVVKNKEVELIKTTTEENEKREIENLTAQGKDVKNTTNVKKKGLKCPSLPRFCYRQKT